MSIFRKHSFPGLRTCMLIVTHSCNLNCKYCYEHHKSDRKMTVDLAKEIILHEVELVKQSNRFTELEIQFMGGEPFVNFELIREVIEWLECIDLGISYHCFAMTNGTLIFDEVREWLMKHSKCLTVGLSYDGTPEMQCSNRGSDRLLDLSWYIQTWPRQGFHMTISRNTLQSLSAGFAYVYNQGGRCRAALAQGEIWTESDAVAYERELRKLADFYLTNLNVDPDDGLLTRPLVNIGVPNRGKRMCGSGSTMVTYDVDGQIYPCHMFSPLVVGNDSMKQTKSDAFEDVELMDSYCKDCLYVNWCPTCYGCNKLLRGAVANRDHNWCEMIEVQFRVSCEFQLRYYHINKSKISEDDLGQLRAAINAFRYLPDRKEVNL